MENSDVNGRTAEVLETLIKRLSDKEETDRARDDEEKRAEKKTQKLYLGIIASIITIFSSVALQLGTPPKVADRSDILTVLKQNQSAARPDPWTGSDDLKAMDVLRNHLRSQLIESWNGIEENQEGVARTGGRLDAMQVEHHTMWDAVHLAEKRLNEGPSRARERLNYIELRLNRLEASGQDH